MKGVRLYLELFHIFSDVARTRSFSKAAGLHFISQSAVSQQIAFLEKRFGKRLIERRRGQCTLTEWGERFLSRSQEILSLYGQLVDELDQNKELTGTVAVKAIYSIGLYALAPYVRKFVKKHPRVNLQLSYERYDRIYADVAGGDSHVGLVAYPTPRSGLQIIPFKSERLALVSPPVNGHKRRHRLKLSDLHEAPFVAFSKDIPTRTAIDQILRDAGIGVRVIQEFDNVETVKRAVEVGLGHAVLPGCTVIQEHRAGTVFCSPLAARSAVRPTGILTSTERPLPRAATAFVEWLANTR